MHYDRRGSAESKHISFKISRFKKVSKNIWVFYLPRYSGPFDSLLDTQLIVPTRNQIEFWLSCDFSLLFTFGFNGPVADNINQAPFAPPLCAFVNIHQGYQGQHHSFIHFHLNKMWHDPSEGSGDQINTFYLDFQHFTQYQIHIHYGNNSSSRIFLGERGSGRWFFFIIIVINIIPSSSNRY